MAHLLQSPWGTIEYFHYGVEMLTSVNYLDRMDGITYEAHIYPSKYDSRRAIVTSISDALENLGICSICGDGATSLAKKLTIFLKKNGSYSRVAMLTVSRNPNLEEIQKDFIQQLGRGVIGRCLLILDGFWWELKNRDFREIGIPSPSESFRIVFTARNEDVCEKIGRHQIFHIHIVEDEEAWDLFREIAGKSIVDLDLHETARKIVDECDGCRTSILIIASALKGQPAKVWKDSLTKLQNVHHEDSLTKLQNAHHVYARIQLSYELLNDKEAQSLFLLCCLFPEDFNVRVEDLVLFGMGLQLLENVDSMCEARDRVECIIRELKNSCFLLDGDEGDFVKVRDMCLDFGVWISSNLEYPYVVTYKNDMKGWSLKRSKYENCRAISVVCKTIEQHPADLKCPNLHLFQCYYGSDSARLPTGFFKWLQNLKVLSLTIPSLSQPLITLKRLRTLCITESISDNRYKKPRPRICDLLGDELKYLEFFSFSTARPYDDFPKEMGSLHNLRYLRFNLERLKYIPEGVLSKLVKLEELYLPLDFIGWGRKEEGGERMNASLSELESLQLTCLRIGLWKGSILAEKFVQSLTRFHVFIGSHVSLEYEFLSGGNSKKVLEVFDVDADDFRLSWISTLVRKSESLRLKQVRNLKYVITWQPKEEFPQWKKICISYCRELEYLATWRIQWTSFSQLENLKLFGLCNLKEIWHGLDLSKIEGSCFGNLGEIQIMFCSKLRYVFSVSVAAELRQLQSLQICFCGEMEQIFYTQQMDNDGIFQFSNPTINTSIHHKSKFGSLALNSITRRLFGRGKQPQVVSSHQQDEVVFPRLKTLEFAYMDKLRNFYGGNHHSILLPSLESLSIFQCNRLEAFCYGLLKTPLLKQTLINGNQYSVKLDLNGVVMNLNC